MNKFSLVVLSLLFTIVSFAQKIDTVISNKYYRSYYSYSIKSPLYVVYDLYKGGGDCKRKTTTFKTGGLRISAKSQDFKGSGYDQGHLVPYEDLAFDCKAAESTFRFYNVMAQTPNLNRGEWKKWEYIVRRISKNDSLVVIAGGSGFKKIIGDGVKVPDFCYKVVWSKKLKVVVYALLFTNEQENVQVSHETITNLEKKIGYEVRQHFK